MLSSHKKCSCATRLHLDAVNTNYDSCPTLHSLPSLPLLWFTRGWPSVGWAPEEFDWLGSRKGTNECQGKTGTERGSTLVQTEGGVRVKTMSDNNEWQTKSLWQGSHTLELFEWGMLCHGVWVFASFKGQLALPLLCCSAERCMCVCVFVCVCMCVCVCVCVCYETVSLYLSAHRRVL